LGLSLLVRCVWLAFPFLACDSIAGLKVISNSLVLVHRRYLMPAASAKKSSLGEVEIIVAKMKISNDNC
jgi:hypothetical protein